MDKYTYNREAARYRRNMSDDSILVYDTSTHDRILYKDIEVVSPTGYWIFLPGLKTMTGEKFREEYRLW